MQLPEITIPADPTLSESLRLLAERAELRRYRKGMLLIEEGDRGDTLYIILVGSLRAFAIGERDREITYGVYGPGEYIGEMSLDGGPRSASVIALEPSVCAVVTQTTLLAFIAERPIVRARADHQADPTGAGRHVERQAAGAQRCVRPAGRVAQRAGGGRARGRPAGRGAPDSPRAGEPARLLA